jgi:hypothetical protein
VRGNDDEFKPARARAGYDFRMGLQAIRLLPSFRFGTRFGVTAARP